MRETLILWADKIIRYGIYALFFLIPLIFTNNTSELFELNKMWLTWEITLFIGAAWFAKMFAERRLSIQLTPLDIPLMLFLLSQIIATVISLDTHTSFWGYYSRFNGGLLSTITYIFLYYVIVSNLRKAQVIRVLMISLVSGFFVALWGLPSHFGKDPTCLLFQGTFDVSCWTDAFKPTVRIFSTLGQPAWMAAYLNVLIPVTIAFAFFYLPEFKNSKTETHANTTEKLFSFLSSWQFLSLVLLSYLFYLNLIFTSTRAGTIAVWVAALVFWGILYLKRFFSVQKLIILAVLFNGVFLLLNFSFSTTFPQLDRYTLPSLMAAKPETSQPTSSDKPAAPAGSFEGTDSGKIRQIVWKGAIDVWRAYPIFGSGVETFAFAYYQYRPQEHNMTSEWDYLYNKAHNEYLNYLATTGLFGLLTYLAFILMFLFVIIRALLRKGERDKDWLLAIALIAAFISILITNFFAFSVVIMNLYLFLIPAFTFILIPSLLPQKKLLIPRHVPEKHSPDLSGMQWTGILLVSILACYLLLVLIRFWYADTAYALGSNLSRVQEYQQSYLKLGEAVNLRPSEPLMKDEFAINNAMISVLLSLQAEASTSAEIQQQAKGLADQAIALSTENVANHPNNISFWKNRVRLFYALAQVDPKYLPYAVEAVERVTQLAPTDAKVMYNLGALYRESKRAADSSRVLEKTILLKPDYRDAYFALAVAYNDQAINASGRVTNPAMRQKAVEKLQYLLEHINPGDKEAEQTLASWGA